MGGKAHSLHCEKKQYAFINDDGSQNEGKLKVA